jgi:hypothetical protein
MIDCPTWQEVSREKKVEIAIRTSAVFHVADCIRAGQRDGLFEKFFPGDAQQDVSAELLAAA